VTDPEPCSDGRRTTEVFAALAASRPEQRYVLVLYIAGMTPRSSQAIERIRAICDSCLLNRYELTVIDLYLHPEEARRAQVVVAPTLVQQSPTPVRMFVGDMLDEAKILRGLNITN